MGAKRLNRRERREQRNAEIFFNHGIPGIRGMRSQNHGRYNPKDQQEQQNEVPPCLTSDPCCEAQVSFRVGGGAIRYLG